MQNSETSSRPGVALNAMTSPQPRFLLTSMIASIAVGIVMGKLTRGPVKKQVQAFDTRLLKVTRKAQKLHLEPAMELLSDLGENPPLYGLSGILAITRLLQHDAGESATLGLAVVGSAAINQAVKLAVNRPRPYLRLPLPQSRPAGSSFPSNHALMSLATYGTIACLINRKRGNKRSKSLSEAKRGEQSPQYLSGAEHSITSNPEADASVATPPGYSPSRRRTLAFIGLPALLCFMIGWSRVYRGVHNPSDVLGGWIVASIWLIGCTRRNSGQNRG